MHVHLNIAIRSFNLYLKNYNVNLMCTSWSKTYPNYRRCLFSCHIFLWRIPPRAFSSQNIACDVFRTRFRLAVYTQFFCKGNSCAICMCIETDKVWEVQHRLKSIMNQILFLNEMYISISLKSQLFTFLSLSILHSDFKFFSAKNTSGSWKHSAVDSLKESSVVSEIVMFLKNLHCLIQLLWW